MGEVLNPFLYRNGLDSNHISNFEGAEVYLLRCKPAVGAAGRWVSSVRGVVDGCTRSGQ